MKILVTGSEGNIGRKLAPYLRKCGHEVMRMDIMQEYADDYIKHDVRDPLYTCDLPFKPEVVFHLAGMVSRITCEKAPHLAVDTNIVGTSNIIQFCKSMGAKLVNFSTSEVYGNQGGVLCEDKTGLMPNNIYGVTKLMVEQLVDYEVKNYLLRAVVVRPFMIYDESETKGVHRSAMVRFAEALVKKEKIVVHKGSERSWLHTEDAVRLFEKCMYLNDYHVINIGNPNIVSMMYIAKCMCTELGLDPMKYIIEKELPKKMTLVKRPSLEKQKDLLKYFPIVDVETGVGALIKRMQCKE